VATELWVLIRFVEGIERWRSHAVQALDRRKRPWLLGRQAWRRLRKIPV